MNPCDEHRALTATRPNNRARRLYPDTVDTWTGGIDWIAVERAANGELARPRTALTPAERAEAWRLMLANHISKTEAARRTGCDSQLIDRWAKANGFTATAAKGATTP